MEKIIRDFPNQFKYEPEIINSDNLIKTDKFIVCGMGGSHLPAGLLKTREPHLDLLIHRDYGLPQVPEYFLNESLLIASSYSGNTEEVIDFLESALEAELNIAVITATGELLKLAKKHRLPYIELPMLGLPPRAALGFATLALAKLIGDESQVKELAAIASTLDVDAAKGRGEALAEKFKSLIPVVYSSRVNLPLAYNWKIKLNETAKFPAFYNAFPELNHNELEGFGHFQEKLSPNFGFVLLSDEADHPRILKRLRLTEEILSGLGFPVIIEELSKESPWIKIFQNLLVADWLALTLAKRAGTNPEAVPLIEDFKEKLAD